MIVLPYLVFSILEGLYSYSQFDPNLTLFSDKTFLSFQNAAVHFGLFMRGESAIVFLAMTVLGFLLYGLTIRLIGQGKISLKQISIILCTIVLFGTISYPAFSKDIFNYIFDAKILSQYHLNPYLFKPLDFPSDNWLRFMTWTHRTYPYGPFWLALTAPLNFIAQNHFVATLLIYKIFFSINYLISTFLIYKIVTKINPKKALLAAAVFALNPLVITESVVSPHLDISMTLFMLLGFFFLQQQKKGLSIVAFLFSGGVKFLTLPLLFLPFFKNVSYLRKVKLSLAFLTLALLPLVVLREAYPWYFVLLISLLCLLDAKRYFVPLMTISFGLSLQYAPYIFFGEYIPEVFFLKNVILIIATLLAGTLLLVTHFLSAKAENRE